MHLDSQDRSLTILALHQGRDTPAPHRAYFQCNNHALPMAGGITIIFDGRDSFHGAWADPFADGNLYPWTGCAIVCR